MNQKETAILQTVVFLLDNVKEFEILKYNLAPHLKKAKTIVRLIRN